MIERLGVRRKKVRKEIENMVMSGMVEIRRGKGKLVEEKKIRKELNELRGLVEDMVELGRKKKENMIEKR